MTNLREVFAMKDRVNEGSAPILIILEKASMLVCLLIVVAIGLALELPSWGHRANIWPLTWTNRFWALLLHLHPTN